ncbi:MAG TPA: aminotransferase class V-fold PLP-dependent enzyme [Syntrophorhabdaceae bacterium]
MIYLDNSATSHPKPPQTMRYMVDFVTNVGGNPGRSGHTASVEAARIIFRAREKLASLIKAPDSERIIFTQNGTDSLNLAILGILGEADHVITTSMEHNSVMRPLTYLQNTRKVQVSIADCAPHGELDPERIKGLIKKNTKAVIINHGSNVTGGLQDLRGIRAATEGLFLIVDACQTIGSFPIDVVGDRIDALCFSCHKSLYGVQGLGAVYLREGVTPIPLRFGGTGSRSESIEQPTILPDCYESGTPNTPGIASLLGGLTFIEETGIGKIMEKEGALMKALRAGLEDTGQTTIYGAQGSAPPIPVLSFNIKGKLPSEVGYELNKRGIYVRVGLHCSPEAHRTIGTFPHGAVRVSPGYFTGESDIAAFIEAVREIAET